MANDQFNAGVFVGGSAFGIGAMMGSVMAGMQNATVEIDEIVQEHYEQRDLKEFFDGVQATHARAQNTLAAQAEMIKCLSGLVDALQRDLAVATGQNPDKVWQLNKRPS